MTITFGGRWVGYIRELVKYILYGVFICFSVFGYFGFGVWIY